MEKNTFNYQEITFDCENHISKDQTNTPLIDNEVKIDNERQFDKISSDSDSTASLVSRVKNPKKRRTSRVEYNPTNRNITMKLNLFYGEKKSKSISERKMHKKKDTKQIMSSNNDKSNNFKKSRTREKLKSRSDQNEFKDKDIIEEIDQKLEHSISSQSSIQRRRMIASKPFINPQFLSILKKIDSFDIEIEDFAENFVGASHIDCTLCNHNISSKNYSVINNDAYYHINLTFSIGESDINNTNTPDKFDIVSINKSNSNISNLRNSNKKVPKSSINENEVTDLNSKHKQKRLLTENVKNESGNCQNLNISCLNTSVNVISSTSTPMLNDEIKEDMKLSDSSFDDLINASGNNFSQRSSARLRQIQTQKTFHSTTSDSSFIKPIYTPDTLYFQSLSSNSTLSPTTTRNSMNNNSHNTFLSSSINYSNLASYEPQRLPITELAISDPIIRSAYENTTRKMKKIEDYFDICESLYFGKLFNLKKKSYFEERVSKNQLDITTSKPIKHNLPLSPSSNNAIDSFSNSTFLIKNLILSNNNQINDTSKISISNSLAYKSQSKSSPGNLKKTNSIPTVKSTNKYQPLTPLELLMSPLRKPHILDFWAPKEVCMFEAAICKYGKDFFKIQRVIQSKSSKDIVDFYYLWKKSSRYNAWKEFRNLSETIPVKFFD